MYYISLDLAIAIYNDDYSALNNAEYNEIKGFLSEIKGAITFDFENKNFTRCNVTGLGAECCTYEII